jgi:hypothetical protein
MAITGSRIVRPLPTVGSPSSSAMRPRTAQFRPLETIAYPGVAGPTRTKIPREFVLSDLSLWVTGTVTIGTADATSLRSEQPMSILRRVQIMGASGERPTLAQIKDADAAAMFRLQHILHGTPGLNTPVSAVAQAAYAWSFLLDIDFLLTGMIEDRNKPFSGPGETLLRGDEMNALDLLLEWGDGSDLVLPAATTTYALTVTQAVLGVREYKDADSLSQRYKIHRLSNIEQVNAGATTNFVFDLRGRNVLRGILLKQFTKPTTGNLNPHIPVTTVIANAQLRLNGEIRENWTPIDLLTADNKTEYSVETMPTGYHFLDLSHGGQRELLVNPNQYSSVDLILTTNTVANSYVRAYVIEVVA